MKTIRKVLNLAIMVLTLAEFFSSAALAAPVAKAGGAEYDQALLLAIEKNQTEKVLSLLAKGANPNACLTGQLAKPPKQRYKIPALVLAFEGPPGTGLRPENVRIVEALLNAGADINSRDERGSTALMMAASQNQVGTVKLLLDRGANPALKDLPSQAIVSDRGLTSTVTIAGRTALEYAIEFNALDHDYRIIKLLLEKGADVNVADESGQTVLMRVSAFGDVSLVRLILAYHPRIEAKDSFGATALMIAANNEYTNIILTLLAHGANINATDNKGETPLMYCILEWTRPSIVRLLLAHGADARAKAHNGDTALKLAYSDGNDACAHVLKQYLEGKESSLRLK